MPFPPDAALNTGPFAYRIHFEAREILHRRHAPARNPVIPPLTGLIVAFTISLR
jgi:hypothetical protein